MDLDALLIKANLEETLKIAKDKVEADLDDGVWFRFEDQIDLDTQGEYGGIRQVYRAGVGEVLKNLKKAQIINFDLGIGDPITPGPQDVETQSILQKGEDFSWSVYPIETICAEKLHALISHGNENSRSKDIHDLAIFLKQANSKTLHKAIKRCFDYRETTTPPSFSSALKNLNTTMLERGWENAVSSVKNATSFKEAFETVVHLLDDLEEKSL